MTNEVGGWSPSEALGKARTRSKFEAETRLRRDFDFNLRFSLRFRLINYVYIPTMQLVILKPISLTHVF